MFGLVRMVSPDEPVVPPAIPPLREMLAELQRICAEENYSLPVAPRKNRRNAFTDPLPRPKRRKSRR